MKILLPILFICISAQTLCAQSYWPIDPDTRLASYQEVIRLNPTIKTKDVMDVAEQWFGNAIRFKNDNGEVPLETTNNKKIKQRAEVEKDFENEKPLQMTDPSGGKITALATMRYYLPSGQSIKLMYLKYNIYMEIKAGQVTISATNIRYFHVNPSSFKEAPLFGFGGGKPCEPVGKIEALIACQNFNKEFDAMSAYYSSEVKSIFADWKAFLKQKKMLEEPKPAVVAKTAAKTPVKGASKPKATAASKPAAVKK